MKLPTELEDHYVKKVLYNTSLENLPDEEWKPVENYENYMISNYGRLKSLERQSTSLFGKERMLPEKMMKLIFVKHFNRYLQDSMYHVHCTLSVEGNKYRKSVARLVYYHFVEKFDLKDRTIAIISKDGNSLHIHSNNLEKVSASQRSLKIYRMNRARNRNVIYLQPLSQYTVEGKLVAHFEDMYTAGEAVGVLPESIMDVVYKEFLTAGGFRWFLQSYHPEKKDFLITDTSDHSERIFNLSLWKKLGQPKIKRNNPPACMNLSIKDLPDECWRLISGFESRFAISNKGRIKRLSSWISPSPGRKIFLKEQILSQIMGINSSTTYSLYSILRHKGKNKRATITKLLYYYFVEEFDLNDNTMTVVNQNSPLWEIDISKLILCPIYDVLKGKVNIKKT